MCDYTDFLFCDQRVGQKFIDETAKKDGIIKLKSGMVTYFHLFSSLEFKILMLLSFRRNVG